MRIRSIKPEFWRSQDIADLEWSVIYNGPMPKRVNLIAPMVRDTEYVYMLFDEADELVYVGRSFRPADRFTKHSRKPWWPQVTGVVFVRVTEPWTGERAWIPAPNVSRFELAAISELAPRENIAGVSRKAVS